MNNLCLKSIAQLDIWIILDSKTKIIKTCPTKQAEKRKFRYYRMIHRKNYVQLLDLSDD